MSALQWPGCVGRRASCPRRSRALDDDLPLMKRDGGFVRAGFEPVLDETRNLRDASRLVVASMQARYADDSGVKGLKIRHNNVLGYFVEVTAQHGDKLMAPPLNAALVSLWLRDGSFGLLVAAVRAEAVARRRIVAQHLAGFDYTVHPEGYHMWLRTRPGIEPRTVIEVLRPTGLSAVPGSRFLIDKSEASPFVRLSIGGAIGHERLSRAARTLAELRR
jgi:hypothetical protein